MTLFYYRCPTCDKRVGQIDTKYNPWCAHGNTTRRLAKMTMMQQEQDDNLQGQDLDGTGKNVG